MPKRPPLPTGFSLVELTIVLVLLALLAAIAAPKFIDLQREARAAALTQFAASVAAANRQLEMLAKMPSYRAQPVQGRPDLTDVDIDGDGHFETRLKCANLDNTDVLKRLDYSDDKFTWQLDDPEYLYVGFAPSNRLLSSQCYFRYTQANGSNNSCPVGAKAHYQLETSGC
ncbi:prepilin-type N-terminal cleavage/methylation domain-containing protein [Ferrimonas senticii]|uniref:prepilin-type N-terminal cleavage/methylation domain-containing protein n=1 Tax=Ferrimonas senticii TaxID=394566 RepID=UPI000412CC95|nr:prepilin-type N-terminal cleavage/methylation domain-containing protein [Ferrimonas senticii]